MTPIPISVVVQERSNVEKITLAERQYMHELVFTLGLALVSSHKVARELARVSLLDGTVDQPTLDARAQEIQNYLLLQFPIVEFTASPESKDPVYAWPDRDDRLLHLQKSERQRIRHTIFVNVLLYAELNRVHLRRASGLYISYYEPTYESFLIFFLMVCMLHELGHIVRTVFSAKPTPPKYNPSSKEFYEGEAGFDVERWVLGGRVILGYSPEHSDKSNIRQWENVKVIGFQTAHKTYYLSCEQK
ncbi:hypothetical protein MPER_10843, partial [Moniliophthora perniciosa FA553]